MRQDRGALGDGGRKPACMIEVRVRIHYEPDWLARNRLPGCRHHRDAARIALPAFDDENVIAHVDGKRCVISADLEDAVSDALDGVAPPVKAEAAGRGCSSGLGGAARAARRASAGSPWPIR